MSTKSKIKEWYDRNEEFAKDCGEYAKEDPPGDMMYDAFVEFVEVMKIISELGKNENEENN